MNIDCRICGGNYFRCTGKEETECEVCEGIKESFEIEDSAVKDWMNKPNAGLRGKTPREVAEDDKSYHVFRIMWDEEWGIPS